MWTRCFRFTLSLQFFDPWLCTFKRILQVFFFQKNANIRAEASAHHRCDVVNNNGSLCATIIHWRQTVISGKKKISVSLIRSHLSCPAVSQISNLTVISFKQTVCVRKAAVVNVNQENQTVARRTPGASAPKQHTTPSTTQSWCGATQERIFGAASNSNKSERKKKNCRARPPTPTPIQYKSTKRCGVAAFDAGAARCDADPQKRKQPESTLTNNEPYHQ